MLRENEKITLSGDEAINVLKEINLILISLHDMGSYYMDKDKREYEKETTRFIDEWKVTHRLSKIRGIISEKFNNELGNDDMDDLERAMERLKYWQKPGDNAENSKTSTKPQHGYEIKDKVTGDVGKTGISGQPLNKNGTSPRANSQVNKLNKQAGYNKYEADVVNPNIPDRQSALDWEKNNAQKLWDEGNSMNLHKRPRPWED